MNSLMRGILGVVMVAALCGCSSMGTMAVVTKTATSRPVTATAVQTPQQVSPANLQGMDFTQAVAALAQTPGSGVVSVNRPSQAMALAPTKPVTSSKPVTTSPRSVAPKAATAPVVQPQALDCSVTPLPSGCPVATVFGDSITPVRRF